MSADEPSRKRRRELAFPRYRDVTCEIVNVTKVMCTTPYVFCRDDDDGDWSLRLILLNGEFLIHQMAPHDPHATMHPIHQVMVKVPVNEAAREELPEHYYGYCIRYLGPSLTTISSWALSMAAQRLHYTL